MTGTKFNGQTPDELGRTWIYSVACPDAGGDADNRLTSQTTSGVTTSFSVACPEERGDELGQLLSVTTPVSLITTTVGHWYAGARYAIRGPGHLQQWHQVRRRAPVGHASASKLGAPATFHPVPTGDS